MGHVVRVQKIQTEYFNIEAGGFHRVDTYGREHLGTKMYFEYDGLLTYADAIVGTALINQQRINMFVWKNVETGEYLTSTHFGKYYGVKHLNDATVYKDKVHAYGSMDPNPETIGFKLTPVTLIEREVQ